jgi:hypothetical protein
MKPAGSVRFADSLAFNRLRLSCQAAPRARIPDGVAVPRPRGTKQDDLELREGLARTENLLFSDISKRMN